MSKGVEPAEFFKTQGQWEEHPEFPLADWKYQIENNDTRQGYQEWCQAEWEARGDGGQPVPVPSVLAKFDVLFCRHENQVVTLEVEASSREAAQVEGERMLSAGEVSFGPGSGMEVASAEEWVDEVTQVP